MTERSDLARWRRILVRLPNWVGDVVMATPALAALRQQLPEVEIVAALKRYVAPLVLETPLADKILAIEPDQERGIFRAWTFARRLRREGFDACILLTNSLTSALPIFLAGIPERIGYAGDWRGPLLTYAIPQQLERGRRVPMPMPLYYQAVLDAIGIPAAGPRYVLEATATDRERARELLEPVFRIPKDRIVALNPGARFGASKLWAPERFAALARWLRDARGAHVLVLGGPGEEELCRNIAAASGEGVFDLASKGVNLAELRGVLEKVDLLVTTDSGPRHIAVALGKPVVVVMGPTHPAWTAWNLEHTVVVRHHVDCGPCHLRRCPLDHRCMDQVSLAEVQLAVDRLFGMSRPD